ncbi:transglutaminase family protein [Pseudalkalibacillus caeni]|uniref:Transglutaminase family protein n=1 Tax=Exobacillus caeni TaxID=2574798 RepID=A0A5R9FHK0_9BACL|nr:transglutaminase family protein [Pseudalkalibacillus caeni]TLS39045.1 transglutaminase family protein [Pseudalkalibacillus caeni]
MKFEVSQTNHYDYSLPVKQSINQFKLKPIDEGKQRCLSYTATIDPPSETFIHRDYWGNAVETFYLWEEHDFLTIDTNSIVEITPLEGIDEFTLSEEQKMAFQTFDFRQEYAEFLTGTDYTHLPDEILHEATDELWQNSRDPYEFVKMLNAYLYEKLSYRSGATTVKTTAQEVFEKREGVCQDYTHLMLALCRYRGIPARYVSGYIYIGENSALRGDAATHAWVEVKMPGWPWIGIDPTNNIIVKDQHIKVAVGRDYRDIVPLKGVYIGGDQTLAVSVSVKKSEES